MEWLKGLFSKPVVKAQAAPQPHAVVPVVKEPEDVAAHAAAQGAVEPEHGTNEEPGKGQGGGGSRRRRRGSCRKAKKSGGHSRVVGKHRRHHKKKHTRRHRK
jgi:hypothetical protein